MSKKARFVVGIDLGTTNSVLAYAPAEVEYPEDTAIEILPVPQVTAPGEVEARAVLSSFLYLPSPGEVPAGSLDLPWARDRDFAVGAFAQTRGAEMPRRLVCSAKSWLCHGGVDRTAAILPWGAEDESRRVSPVAASAAYLAHLKAAWDHSIAAKDRSLTLEHQEVFLAVPASFDAVARELTVRAAAEVGLKECTLIEEPQAAFYAWIASAGREWRGRVRVGDVILICDVGGGTTDFSLIAVGERQGDLALERIAVGNHILLGGDNMDLAIAYSVREKLKGKGTEIDEWQFRGLTQGCRIAKERLLADDAPDSAPVAVLGRSRRVVGGTLKTELRRDEIERVLVDGFFPVVAADERPRAAPRSGLQEMGLPYASDPAITRHLGGFLARQTGEGKTGAPGGREATSGRPTAILFNGGVMKGALLRSRVAEVLGRWEAADGGRAAPRVLTGTDLDLAVARGAAYYGIARRGRGVRIRGGAARSYYIGIETSMPAVPGVPPPIKALCMAPFGMEEGTEEEIGDREFGLVVGEPTAFRFFHSTTRRRDAVAAMVEAWEPGEIEELSPVETSLPWEGQEGMTVPVRLRTRLTELGTLELWCVARDGDRRWKLEFNLRAAEPQAS